MILPEKMEQQLESLIREGQVGNKAELVRTALAQYLLSIPSLSQKDYDTTLGFAPNGRIYQVEYAYEAVNHGPIAIGVCCGQGVVLIKEAVYTKSQPTWVSHTHRFIDNPSEQIAIATCGIGADAQLIVKQSRKFLQDASTSGSNNLGDLADHLSTFVHAYTLKKNVRPLGASLLIGGLDQDGTPKLYSIDPSGTLWDSQLGAIGSQSQEAMHTLLIGVATLTTLEDAIQLGLAAALRGKDNLADYTVEVISRESPQFRELTPEENARYYES